MPERVLTFQWTAAANGGADHCAEVQIRLSPLDPARPPSGHRLSREQFDVVFDEMLKAAQEDGKRIGLELWETV